MRRLPLSLAVVVLLVAVALLWPSWFDDLLYHCDDTSWGCRWLGFCDCWKH